MNAIEAILLHLDGAWKHAWESLENVLEGVTDEEFAWQPPGYTDTEHEGPGPLPGSIAWHVAHLTACKQEYACCVRDRGKDADLGGAEHEIPPTRKAAHKALEQAHAWLRHQVAALEPAELDLVTNNQMPLGEFLAAVVRHDAWHGGQIALVRRLYRSR